MSEKSIPTSISGIVAKDAHIENTPDMTASFVRVIIEITEGPRKGDFETVIVARGKAVAPEKAMDPSDTRHKPQAHFLAGSKITVSRIDRTQSDTPIAGFVSVCAPLKSFKL